MFSIATAATDLDSSVEMDCLSDNIIKPSNVEAYDDRDSTVIWKPGRFDVIVYFEYEIK